MILAAIDIGSNACRMLINQATPYSETGTTFTKLNLLRIPLRLGFDVFKNGFISDEKIEMIIDSMHAYRSLEKIYKVERLRACATSAMRNASNSKKVIDTVREETGINIELISGSEEATILFNNHLSSHLNKNDNYIYIDVGGGSTEVTFFSNKKVLAKNSFKLGTIRILTKTVDTKEWTRMTDFINKTSSGIKDLKAIGTGGNINKVFSLSKKRDGRPIDIELLDKYYSKFSSLSIEERMREFKIRKDRADVIVPALSIYRAALKTANVEKIYVPKIGLADGVIRQLYNELINTKKNK